jgi:hypothetical protein
MAGLEASMILHLLFICFIGYQRAGGKKYDENDGREDAEDQGADVQALGSGGIGLGPSHIAHHLPVPGLEETRW